MKKMWRKGRQMRWAAIGLFGFLVTSSFAFPPFLATFDSTYHPAASSALGMAKCATCHTTGQGGPRNPYGHALEGLLDRSATSELTAAILHQADNLDSDGDGTSNAEEIAAGRLPGKEDVAPPSRAPATPAAAAEPIPKHSFHPIIVHFPIALFLFGAAIDAFAIYRRRPTWRDIASWNMVVGALSGWAAIATGVVAALRLGYTLTPGKPVFTHLAFAALATVLMGAVSYNQVKKRPTGVLYFLLLGLAAAAVAIAGHLGGDLVYG